MTITGIPNTKSLIMTEFFPYNSLFFLEIFVGEKDSFFPSGFLAFRIRH